ncbi:hypothetical protein CI109_105774 [Kwoniella shandongensis]|uniref:Uncharacterized protein n=1 Tax=Kwoniella shandongensis TaxID=1734106 RepID=A0A5M6C1K3_9TREE|nr:uncharacterized protein CI109_003113 [Kwoniella shandongensis]KAA5528581.1 hypothetical protein CI109_003113 [Kwoniella shandongensis]
MPSVNRTPVFQSILTTQLSSLPQSSRSKSPSGRSTSRERSAKGKGKDESSRANEEFLKEAYRIHAHLSSLQHLLVSVRKPYLSTVEPPPLSRRAPRDTDRRNVGDGEDGDDVEEWRKWERVKYLTDRERDEIDLRARMILRRCKERVGALELSEQTRKSKTSTLQQTKTTTTLLSLLPSLAPLVPNNTYEPLLTAHRASILWTLNDFLAKLTGTVGDMQEERAKRREERSKTLGAGASNEAARLVGSSSAGREPFHLPIPKGAEGRKIPDGVVVAVDDPAFSPIVGSPDHHTTASTRGGDGNVGMGIIDPNSPPIESQLSQEQIQAFESENNALLEHMSSTLSSVLSAESSLLEISQLQSELVRHLAQQTEVVEQLYEDAVGSVADVGRANEQLKKARERGKEGRLFLLIFLIGASLGLLFLDWYAK